MGLNEGARAREHAKKALGVTGQYQGGDNGESVRGACDQSVEMHVNERTGAASVKAECTTTKVGHERARETRVHADTR